MNERFDLDAFSFSVAEQKRARRFTLAIAGAVFLIGTVVGAVASHFFA